MASEQDIKDARQAAAAFVDDKLGFFSDFNQKIWRYAEPALREYRSAAAYVALLEAEGFAVEQGSAGLPTAFVARDRSEGPHLAAYAEYDAIPGCSQDAVPFRAPLGGNPHAAGHTDPHSALGVSALAGLLAARAVLAARGVPVRFSFFGEPGEKVCASKCAHAAAGYYNDIDAAISFHPTYIPELSNTVVLETHCGAYASVVYSFSCPDAEGWMSQGGIVARDDAHGTAIARAPGAADAVCQMYLLTKATKENMLPFAGNWSVNEAILVAGQATADNLPAGVGQIQYAIRTPDLAMQEAVLNVLRNNARHVAALTGCVVEEVWVARTRPALPNASLARLVYSNLERAGAPEFGAEASAFGRALQAEIGYDVTEAPFIDDLSRLKTPEEAEADVRSLIPAWQTHYSTDDYTEYTWHAPTARLYVARPVLARHAGRPPVPGWTFVALGGYPPAIDPMIRTAAITIAMSLVDLAMSPDRLAAARAEFVARTGGGIGGSRWLAPLMPTGSADAVALRWPEHIATARGEDWWIPASPGEHPAG